MKTEYDGHLPFRYIIDCWGAYSDGTIFFLMRYAQVYCYKSK